MNPFIHSRRGQTLVEALIALSILTTGFIGIVALLTKSFQLNRTTSNDTQATYLASEGIEIAKNIIDYDVYYGSSLPNTDDWGCSFDLTPGVPTDYEFEYDTVPPSNCSGVLTPSLTARTDRLYFNPSSTLYSYSSFPPAVLTDFTRDVRITAVSGNELDVRSIVTWSAGSQSNTITLEDHFYDWHP